MYFNIGYFLFDKKNIIKMKKYTKFEKFLESRSIQRFRSYIHYGKHITINTLSELSDAKLNLKNIKHLRKYE